MSRIRILVDTEDLEAAKMEFDAAHRQKVKALQMIKDKIKEIENTWDGVMDAAFCRSLEKTIENIEVGDRNTEKVIAELDDTISEAKWIEERIKNAAGGLMVAAPYD